MKEQQVDRHLDTSCPGSPQAASKRRPTPAQTSQPSTFPSFNTRLTSQVTTANQTQKPPERLPALAYSMLRDTALRKKLSELGLSTHGSRQLLEKRHKEWITLWNANCDSSRPKKRSELLRDLDEWERTVGNPSTAAAGGGGGQQGLGLMARAQATGAQIKDKEFDGKAWATRYGGSFGDLIKQARKGIKRQTLDGNGEKADTKEDITPAELPTLQAREGESSAAPTPMDIVSPSSPPRPGQVSDAGAEHDGQAPGKDVIAEVTAMGEQVIPGTPDKEQWETSQQPPIPGDA